MSQKSSFLHFILISLIINSVGIQQSLSQEKWFKGNTHTHTTYSDGSLTPEEVKTAYIDKGYDFVFFTDENRIAPVDTLSDSTFLCLNGEEAMIDQHISCLNIDTVVAPTDFSQVITNTHLQGGFAVVNHPLRGNHIVPARQMASVDILQFIEIFNGKSEKDLYHDDQSVWDSVLTAGKLVYGIAADDFHELKHISKGWIMVKADTLVKDSIVKAIKLGNFYSSTGAIINNIIVTDSVLTIKSENASEISFIGNNRKLLQQNNNTEATYWITGNEGYIRVEITSTTGKKAWTQPLFWNKVFEGFPEISDLNTTYIKNIQVFPNPVQDYINVSSCNNAKINRVNIRTIAGEIIYKAPYTKAQIDISFLPKGWYFIELQLSDNKSEAARFLKL